MKIFETIGYFLYYTPWWVYLILAYCIFVGIKGLKQRQLAFKRFCIVPIVFFLLGLDTVINMAGVTLINSASWVIALLVGTAMGYGYMWRLRVSVDKTTKDITVPGSWFTMILVLVIFITKYYFGHALGVNPHEIHNVLFVLSMVIVSGLCSGLFVGRLLHVLVLLRR